MLERSLPSPKCFFFLSLLWICHGVATGAPVNEEVTQFPGYEGELPSKHYAGYVTLSNRWQRRHLYYYFATSEKNPFKDPLTIFLIGGPGCSGLSGLLFIIGPFQLDHSSNFLVTGTKVKLNPFSWTKVTNLIFVDIPTFSGYSYAEEAEDFAMDESDAFDHWTTFVSEVANTTTDGCHRFDAMDDISTVFDMYEFIRKWFSKFPEFLANPFYIAGSSYAGVHIAMLAHEIVNGIEVGKEPVINFKGYSSGNAAIDVEIESNAKVPYAYRMGFIPEELYEDLKRSCDGRYQRNGDPECLKNMEIFNKLVKGIHEEHVLCLPCHTVTGNSFLPHEYASIKHFQSLENKIQGDNIYCYDRKERARRLFNPLSSREILHALPEEITGKWKSRTYYPNFRRNLPSLIPLHLELTMKGYRAFFYNGDHDMIVPPIVNLEWIKRLNYSVIDGWRPWFVDEQVAGYTMLFDHNLLFATFKGGGHSVPEYTPREALIAHERWFSGKSL